MNALTMATSCGETENAVYPASREKHDSDPCYGRAFKVSQWARPICPNVFHPLARQQRDAVTGAEDGVNENVAEPGRFRAISWDAEFRPVRACGILAVWCQGFALRSRIFPLQGNRNSSFRIRKRNRIGIKVWASGIKNQEPV